MTYIYYESFLTGWYNQWTSLNIFYILYKNFDEILTTLNYLGFYVTYTSVLTLSYKSSDAYARGRWLSHSFSAKRSTIRDFNTFSVSDV